jgi:hypothetical protein
VEVEPSTQKTKKLSEGALGVAADVHGAAKQKVLTPLVVDTVAAASSLAAGGVMAWREVLSESYANFTSLDLVDDIKKKYRKDFGPELSKKIASGHISKDAATDAILKQNENYNKAIAMRFEEAGFGSFANRLKLLNTHEKWKIGLTALAVTGVALGSIMLITKDLFSSKAQKAEQDTDIQR